MQVLFALRNIEPPRRWMPRYHLVRHSIHYGCAPGDSFDLNGHAIIILCQRYCLYIRYPTQWKIWPAHHVIITIIFVWRQKCNSEKGFHYYFQLIHKWDFCTWNNNIHQMEMNNGYGWRGGGRGRRGGIRANIFAEQISHLTINNNAVNVYLVAGWLGGWAAMHQFQIQTPNRKRYKSWNGTTFQ